MKKVLGLVTFAMAFLFFTTFAMAQDVAPPTFLDGLLKLLSNSGSIIAGILIVVEFIFRAMPTAKPLSVLIPIQYTVKGLVVILTFLADLLAKIIEVANRTKQ